MFDDFILEFKTLITKISEQLKTNDDVSKNVRKLKHLLDSMKMLQNDCSNPRLKREMLLQLKACEGLHEDIHRSILRNNTSVFGDDVSPYTANNTNLFNKLNQNQNQLSNTRRLAHETVDIGNQIRMNLYEQRQQIGRVSHNLQKVDADLDTSKAVVRRMDKWYNS